MGDTYMTQYLFTDNPYFDLASAATERSNLKPPRRAEVISIKNHKKCKTNPIFEMPK